MDWRWETRPFGELAENENCVRDLGTARTIVSWVGWVNTADIAVRACAGADLIAESAKCGAGAGIVGRRGHGLPQQLLGPGPLTLASGHDAPAHQGLGETGGSKAKQ
jgi:hypothetical protein